MNCERVQELIAPFVNEKLNTDETEEFLKHIDSCDDCREELEVSYSLMTAMNQLDAGTDLSDNYIQELDDKIEACFMEGLRKKRTRARRRMLLAAMVLGLLFMTGSMASEKRCTQEVLLFRDVFGVGQENENRPEKEQKNIGQEPEAETDNGDEPLE